MGDRFLLAHGHVAGTLTRDDVDASDLMRLMAGGEEFSVLTDALTALPAEFGDRWIRPPLGERHRGATALSGRPIR